MVVLTGSRVLVVDDEPRIRTVLRGYLEADGFHVQEAADGETALTSVAAEPPDLVILDVMLPGIDGIEVLRRLRTSSDVYVIMVTARAEEVDKLIGLAVGADDYVRGRSRDAELPLTACRRPVGGQVLPEELRRVNRRAVDAPHVRPRVAPAVENQTRPSLAWFEFQAAPGTASRCCEPAAQESPRSFSTWSPSTTTS